LSGENRRVCVRNTFLHVSDESYDQAQKALQMRRSSSDSSLGSRSRNSDEYPSPMAAGSDGLQHIVWDSFSTSSSSVRESSSPSVNATQVQADSDAFKQEAGHSSAMGPEDRASWSVGAALHAEGKCKPCAWNWNSTGCSAAEQCTYCHMCPKDVPIVRLKLRKSRKAAASAKPCHTALQPGLVPGSCTGPSPGPLQPGAVSANVPSRPAFVQPGLLPGTGTGPSPGPAQPRKNNSGETASSAVSSAQASKSTRQMLSL